MDYLSFVLVLFTIELFADIFVLKVFKIYYKRLYLIFLQIPKLCSSVLCLVYLDVLWICVLAKFVSILICILFLTDSFKIKKLISILCLEVIVLFSIGGFLMFILLWLNSSLEMIFTQKFSKKLQILLFFTIILYIFAIFKITRSIEKNRTLKKISAKVSFYLKGKHIVLYGLIDSGNLLIDPLTRKPIVLVSKDSLRKYFSKLEIENLINTCVRKIECDTISGSGYEIPIFKVEKFMLQSDEDDKCFLCMIGLVGHNFEKGKVDCLLHRDFL
ncbi:MAG: sigma-E processing peptidase SpoIIGA [Clostridia bacterium]|nr:sigma-E processing peptidase SpoIIGA [Clostridia bacterium]